MPPNPTETEHPNPKPYKLMNYFAAALNPESPSRWIMPTVLAAKNDIPKPIGFVVQGNLVAEFISPQKCTLLVL